MTDSLIHSLAGAAGGIVAMSATYPLIFLSTRAAIETSKEHKATHTVVTEIIQREGLSGLYSGLSSSLLGIAVTNGVYYFFYEGTRNTLVNRRISTKALTTLESMLAGLIAGCATTIISNPIWVVQTSQAVRTMPNSDSASASTRMQKLGFFDTMKYIIRKDGVIALWRGIGPALVLVVNPILQYTLFEQLKNLILARRKLRILSMGGATSATLSDMDFFWLGAISKLLATSTTYPYIVLKSRLQAGHIGASKYRSSLNGILTVIQEEGFRGLYRGIGSKLIQSVLTAAILFACQRRLYELTKKVASRARQS